MIHVTLPCDSPRALPFYLALEEWVAMHLPSGEYFFTWIVDPTVICGRNQDMALEVDLDYCRARGIDVCRRRSGGGTVYADRHNIMISYITPHTEVAGTFGQYSALVAGQLRAMGIDAVPSGRNDITVGGRKISGGAYYRMPGRSIMHSTMLYDTDIAVMLKAITPSRAKLESKQVKSVASRMTCAREHRPDMDMATFRTALTRGLETARYTLTPLQVAQVEALEQRYRDPAWVNAGAHGAALKRIDGVGEIALVPVRDDSGRLTAVTVHGDAFVTAPLDPLLLALQDADTADAASVTRALGALDTGAFIAGMDNNTFAFLLAAATPLNDNKP